jgi:hypothetical protein
MRSAARCEDGNGTLAPSTAQTISFGDREYGLDEYGFLYPPSQWDEAFA